MLVITPIADWMIAALPEAFGGMFTLHVVEVPGEGNDTHPEGADTVESITRAVADVAGTLPVSPVLFGHSMNGLLALAAATVSPCAGVIAVTPPSTLPPDPALSASYWDEKVDSGRRLRAQQLVRQHEASSDIDERKLLRQQYARLRQWYDPDFDSAELDSLATLNEEWITSVFDSGETIDWPTRLMQVEAPILLVLGAYDFVAPPTAWPSSSLPPHATVHLFDRSGHTPYVEQTDDFLRVVQNWADLSLS
jgi:proline iminopeptidase